jgi:hypothetical protein
MLACVLQAAKTPSRNGGPFYGPNRGGPTFSNSRSKIKLRRNRVKNTPQGFTLLLERTRSARITHSHLHSIFARFHPLSDFLPAFPSCVFFSFLSILLLSFCVYILVYVLSTLEDYYLRLLSFLKTIGLHLSSLPAATKMAQLIFRDQNYVSLYVYIHYAYTLMMMMSFTFVCSYRNNNQSTVIYPVGTSRWRTIKRHHHH